LVFTSAAPLQLYIPFEFDHLLTILLREEVPAFNITSLHYVHVFPLEEDVLVA